MILGIDFSLTSTGVCLISDGEAECATIGSKKEATWDRFVERVEGIADSIIEWADTAPDTVVVLESPAFLAKSSSLDRMFGGWWLLVAELRAHFANPPLLVTPSQLKKFATGKGNAGKDQVLASVIRRYPDVHVAGNDQADALVLAAIGAAAFKEPFNTGLTVFQNEVVEAVRLGRNEGK